jgi:GR25 family glycosyltransferase involved in LPS biosynthesis/tetratricopeptide (TPR) repeat protein
MVKTICLNMIVKNESHIIKDTLINILEHIAIDYWVISDTGSTDNTQQIIIDFFKERNIKGELHEDQWKDFGYNRTIALKHAYNKSDYLFIFDADDKICGNLNIDKTKLVSDEYHLKIGVMFTYYRPLLITNRKKWKYTGVLHEALVPIDTMSGKQELSAGDYHVESRRIGNRSNDPDKYKKDAEVLIKAYETEKDDIGLKHRYAFYAAQSYRDYNQTEKAIEWYKLVLTLNNWTQEKYCSCVSIGHLYQSQQNFESALHYYILSANYDPTRLEGIANACCLCYSKGMHLIVNLLYEKYKHINMNNTDFSTKLFVTKSCYHDEISYYNSISSYYLKNNASGYESCKRNLINNVAAEGRLVNSLDNLIFYQDELKKDTSTFNIFININKLIQNKGLTSDINNNAVVIWNLLFDKHKSLLTKYKKHEFTNRKKPKVLLTFTSCKRFDLFCKTINSILNCWTDIDKVDYWFCVDDNSSDKDRDCMSRLYPWIDYYLKGTDEKGHLQSMNIIYDKLVELKPTYWIHMEDDFLFFDKMNYVETGINGLLSLTDHNIKQILFNRSYGESIDHYNTCSHKHLNDTYSIHEYLPDNNSTRKNCYYWPHYSFRPSIIDVKSVLEIGNFNTSESFFEMAYAKKWTNQGFKSGFLNKITNIHIGRQTKDRHNKEIANAYELNDVNQFNSTATAISKSFVIKNNNNTSLIADEFNHKIKIINLKHREDRRNDMDKKLNACGINNRQYEFIEAVNGVELEPTYEIYDLFKDNDFGYRKGFIGCALSHFHLWQELLKDDTQDYYIILEDDCTFVEGFHEKMKTLENDIKHQDVMFLGYHMFSHKRENVKHLYEFKHDNMECHTLSNNLYIGGFFAYTINKKGAQKLCDYIGKNGIKHGIDYLVKIMPELDCKEIRPQLVFSVWNENNARIDSNIQHNSECFQFTNLINEYVYDKFVFIQGLDQGDYDITQLRNKTIPILKYECMKHDTCIGFNTLGFMKSNLVQLTKSKYFKETDGIYIKKDIYEKWQKTTSAAKYELFKDYRNRHEECKVIAFHDNQLCERGTTKALFDYAYYNQEILHNQSIIFYEKDNSSNVTDIINNFNKHFKVYGYSKWEEVEEIIEYIRCDMLFLIKYGTNDGKLSQKCKNIVQAVFTISDPHGDIFIANGNSICPKDHNILILPHIVKPLPDHQLNLRQQLNIPENAIVFGRHGGYDTFNIPYVQQTIITFAENNPSKYFLFLNTKKFSDDSLKNIIYLDPLFNDIDLVTFINTCNTMIWGRMEGETFGLAIAEFASKHKPIIATKCDEITTMYPQWNLGPYKEHTFYLKDNAFWYDSPETLLNILEKFNTDQIVVDTTLNCYSECSPENVMQLFNDKLIKQIKQIMPSNNKIRVKMLCNWCSSQQLVNEWSNMFNNETGWNNLEMTWEDSNIDYFIIINTPLHVNDYYVPEKTIVFQMEPWVNDPSKKWGVKTWGKWSNPDENIFLKVIGRQQKEYNNVFWQIELTYEQLKELKYDSKKDRVSSICSNKYFDEGHIHRIDFLKFLEEKKDIELDIFGNEPRFKNFRKLITPYKDKSIGLVPYKYYFMVENNYEDNFITEKLWEPILCESLCFYFGCPNVKDIIDERAFVLLDMNDFEKSYQIIKCAIKEDLWSQRIEFIKQEKAKFLSKMAFFPRIENIITNQRDSKHLYTYPQPLTNVCFIHSCTLQQDNTKRLDFLVDYLENSPLYEKLDKIFIINIGNKITNKYSTKFDVLNYSTDNNLYEIPTLNNMIEFSKMNPDCNILYLHNKGISYSDVYQQVNDWISLMLYFLIDKSNLCLDALNNGTQVIGSNYSESPHKHFSGNFWWTKSSYFKTLLPMDEISVVKADGEWFLCRNNPSHTELHHSGINHYNELYSKDKYQS